jgi:hypothetical protein
VSRFIYCYAECRYAESRYAECRYAECRYAECRYTECRYTECHGTLSSSNHDQTVRSLSRTPLAASQLEQCYEQSSNLAGRMDLVFSLVQLNQCIDI